MHFGGISVKIHERTSPGMSQAGSGLWHTAPQSRNRRETENAKVGRESSQAFRPGALVLLAGSYIGCWMLDVRCWMLMLDSAFRPPPFPSSNLPLP